VHAPVVADTVNKALRMVATGSGKISTLMRTTYYMNGVLADVKADGNVYVTSDFPDPRMSIYNKTTEDTSSVLIQTDSPNKEQVYGLWGLARSPNDNMVYVVVEGEIYGHGPQCWIYKVNSTASTKVLTHPGALVLGLAFSSTGEAFFIDNHHGRIYKWSSPDTVTPVLFNIGDGKPATGANATDVEFNSSMGHCN
jgi:hypothetical protein